MKRILPIVFCCFVSLHFANSKLPASSCKEILENTIASVENIRTLKFKLQIAERFNGKLKFSESEVKLLRNPRKIYIRLNGPELLWVEGKNNGNALVNPSGFPYMNLNLDPLGSIMRDNQHHTIYEIGYDYFADIIKNSMQVVGEKFDDYFKCGGILTYDSHECYLLTAEYPAFGYEDYTVQKGESLVTIAQKLKVSDYMLLEINSGKVRNYRDVKQNQKIKVPNVYGSKMIVYIDKALLVPRAVKVYDEKGLFESYEYHNLEVNPKIDDEEFTKEYKDYGF
ncbi:MAG: DUF1571 domain-containing protein [Bacteroidia bacterium]